jgi:hypothetical protein
VFAGGCSQPQMCDEIHGSGETLSDPQPLSLNTLQTCSKFGELYSTLILVSSACLPAHAWAHQDRQHCTASECRTHVAWLALEHNVPRS